MNPRHRLGAERLTVRDGLVVMTAWCHACGLTVTVTGRSARQATRKAYRAIGEHRGAVYAAGPGWEADAA